MDTPFPHDKYKRQPARRFEKEFGLKGIAGRYQFPGEPGMDCASLEKRIDQLCYLPENIARQLGEFIAERQLPRFALSLKNDSKLGRRFEDAFHEFLDQQEDAFVIPALARLEALNPQLEKLEYNRESRMERWWTLNGITSGFNVDDINYFLERVRSRNLDQFDAQPHTKESEELKQKILKRLDPQNAHHSEVERWLHPQKGRNLGWIASRQTLEQMWEQVKNRPMIELPLAERIKREKETPQARTPL